MVKKALLIGINYFKTDQELLGCGNDVKNIGAMLTQYFGYHNQAVTLLTEENGTQRPTKSNIENCIRQLVNGCQKGDTLLLYYSGHGASIQDTNGDESDGKDEVIVPLDFNTNGVVTDDWLYNNLVVRIPEGVNLWVFMDCCHSGTMVDLRFNYKSRCMYKNTNTFPKGIPYNSADWTTQYLLSIENARTNQTPKGNVCLISGCQDEQTSADAFLGNQNQGAFSHCLIETLKANIKRMADGSAKMSTMKLGAFLKEINCRLILNNFNQVSQLSLSNQSDIVERDFAL